MKRLIALLAALTMLFACGCSNTAEDPNQNGTDSNMTDNENPDGMIEDGNTVQEDMQNGMDDMGEAVQDGMDKAGEAVQDGMDKAGDAMTGNDAGVTDGTANTDADTTPKMTSP